MDGKDAARSCVESGDPSGHSHVAGMMQEIMEEVGGDGCLIFNRLFDRRYTIEGATVWCRNCSGRA
jgi:hypothetical protein